MTKFKSWKPGQCEKDSHPHGDFYIEITDDFIYFYGCGAESAMPRRLLPNIVKFLEKEIKHENII